MPMHVWACEVCSGPVETTTKPDLEVCADCIGADRLVHDRVMIAEMQLIALRAYRKGFQDGKRVASRRLGLLT